MNFSTLRFVYQFDDSYHEKERNRSNGHPAVWRTKVSHELHDGLDMLKDNTGYDRKALDCL